MDWFETVLTISAGFVMGFAAAVCLVLYPLIRSADGGASQVKAQKHNSKSQKAKIDKQFDDEDIECSTVAAESATSLSKRKSHSSARKNC